MDLGPSDTFFWLTSTGWVMWNLLVGGLLRGSAIVLYDGAPVLAGARSPLGARRRTQRVTYFGVGAAYLHGCLKADLAPRERFDLSRRSARWARPARRFRTAGFEWVHAASASTCRWARCAAERTSPPRSSGRARRSPSAPARSSAAASGSKRRGVRRGRQADRGRRRRARRSRRPCPRCRSRSGTIRAARATARATSSASRASGRTATGCASPSAARASSTDARTRR